MSITVRKEDLMKLLLLVSKELKDRLPNEGVELTTEAYWHIHPSEWSVMDKDIQPALGLLSEDWELLEAFLKGDKTFTFLTLDKLAILLQAISEEIIPSSADGE